MRERKTNEILTQISNFIQDDRRATFIEVKTEKRYDFQYFCSFVFKHRQRVDKTNAYLYDYEPKTAENYLARKYFKSKWFYNYRVCMYKRVF